MWVMAPRQSIPLISLNCLLCTCALIENIYFSHVHAFKYNKNFNTIIIKIYSILINTFHTRTVHIFTFYILNTWWSYDVYVFIACHRFECVNFIEHLKRILCNQLLILELNDLIWKLITTIYTWSVESRYFHK